MKASQHWHRPAISLPPLSYSNPSGPSHYDSIELLKALSSKSSCHGEATSSLMVDCAAFGSDPSTEEVRINYAVKLAVCEFKTTGVSYPDECEVWGIAAVTKSPAWQSCIKKLEEKPQYWTTLSNNIQNSLALCHAARHEVEKGSQFLLTFSQLLELM